jgi:hypothetical protein
LGIDPNNSVTTFKVIVGRAGTSTKTVQLPKTLRVDRQNWWNLLNLYHTAKGDPIKLLVSSKVFFFPFVVGNIC